MTGRKNMSGTAAVIWTAALLLCSCGGRQTGGYSPVPGDLLFTLSGNSEMSGAISSATAGVDAAGGATIGDSAGRDDAGKDDAGRDDAGRDDAGRDSAGRDDAGRDDAGRDDAGGGHDDDFDHVGIFAVVDGVPSVIEAAPEKGVAVTPLDGFFRDAGANGGGVVVKRLKEPGDEVKVNPDECVRRALEMVGLPYDWSFRPDNGKIYCSELVYESFLDSAGNHIFTAVPMNFRDTDGNLPEFWEKLFKSLGESVPEGVPGTNPNGLARESCLTEVYRSR